MKELNKKIQAQFALMCATGKLFKSTITGQEVWDKYLNSFFKKDDPIFRDPESSTHNCQHCNNFVRRYGNVVAVGDDLKIMTLFDVITEVEYQASMNAMSKLLREASIANIFFETFDELKGLPYETCRKEQEVFRLGTAANHKRYTKEEAAKYGVVKANEVKTFNHMHLDLPARFVATTSESIESIQARYRTDKEVFLRAMVEIPLDTLELVKDLINQGSLLDGATHVGKVETMIDFKKHFNTLSDKKRDNWAWIASYKLAIAKFKNELIGVLCSELAEGEELNKACESWNKRVDPANYMKAVAPITEAQKNKDVQIITELGYIDSFNRRLAVIDDIKADEIKHMNIGDGALKEVNIFDSVKTSTSSHKRNEFKGIEEVSIDKFMKDILPGCTSIEAYLENRQEGNLVTITTSVNEDTKPMFKWDNNYSWTYNGNLAGKSMIKEAVKSRGGKTTGVVNIRMAFPDTTSDYDLHVEEPKFGHISYRNVREAQRSSGMLDLDAQGVDGHQPSEKRVENVIYTDINKMPDGDYVVSVNDYSGTRFPADCTIEVEVADETNVFVISGKETSANTVKVCTIRKSDKEFKVLPSPGVKVVSSNTITKELYGLETQAFHKVNLVCLSPNHWGENNLGNKHYFFMLDECKANTPLRSFHSENLNSELVETRKTLERFGAVNMIEPKGKQLSGLGFNATVKDEVILRLKGNFKRVIKVKFN